MEKSIKQLYREILVNEHYKPILSIDENILLRKQIAETEKVLKANGTTDEQLDKIFEEAKGEVMLLIKKLCNDKKE